jgi:hypothetical protein
MNRCRRTGLPRRPMSSIAQGLWLRLRSGVVDATGAGCRVVTGWVGLREARSEKAHQLPGHAATGQRAGLVRIGEPITGAGLDPSCAPAGIPSNGSDGEGCWGRGTAAGTQADVGVVVVRVVAVPVGGAAVVRFVEPGAAAQQLGDPPSPIKLEALGRAGNGQTHGGQTAGAWARGS